MPVRSLNLAGEPRLVRHSSGPDEGATNVEAAVVLGPNGFAAQFLIFGDANLVLPPRRKPRRTSKLWEHTCLEVFLKPEKGPGYLEFNFSPSTRWAAYEFDDYREGMRPLHMGAPSISTRRMGDNFFLLAQFRWRGWEKVAAWRLGLSAVIETTSGARSYWALKHPPGAPDFHHPDCFALELPAA